MADPCDRINAFDHQYMALAVQWNAMPGAEQCLGNGRKILENMISLLDQATEAIASAGDQCIENGSPDHSPGAVSSDLTTKLSDCMTKPPLPLSSIPRGNPASCSTITDSTHPSSGHCTTAKKSLQTAKKIRDAMNKRMASNENLESDGTLKLDKAMDSLKEGDKISDLLREAAIEFRLSGDIIAELAALKEAKAATFLGGTDKQDQEIKDVELELEQEAIINGVGTRGSGEEGAVPKQETKVAPPSDTPTGGEKWSPDDQKEKQTHWEGPCGTIIDKYHETSTDSICLKVENKCGYSLKIFYEEIGSGNDNIIPWFPVTLRPRVITHCVAPGRDILYLKWANL